MTGPKRARKVCFRCHKRKVRCDLEVVSTDSCTPCVEAGAECQLRPSHKGRRPLKTAVAGSVGHLEAHTAQSQRGLASRYLEHTAVVEDQSAPHESVALYSTAHPSKIQDEDVHAGLQVFSDFCYPWTPILEPKFEEDVRTLPLRQAFALLTRTTKTSFLSDGDALILRHDLQRSFYASLASEEHRMLNIQTALLLCWHGSEASNSISMSSSFKLVGFAIRLAQEAGLHRESKASESQGTSSLRRRIWWTLFARERFMAICQGLPCLIDQDYYDVDRPTLQDFSSYRTLQAQIFLQSISLAEAIAHTNKQLIISRRTGDVLPSAAITAKLVAWLSDLPTGLQLSICTAYTGTFDRDIHLLHLPYLNAITLIYLYTSNEQLPQASVAGVLAAGCTTRILGDLLRSERAIMLPEETGWYAATAALALAHVRALDILAEHAAEDIAILQRFLERSAQTWHGSSLLKAGVDRALAKLPLSRIETAHMRPVSVPNTLDDLCAGDGVAWPAFFPFATTNTSRLVETILVECQSTFPQLWLSTVPGGFDAFLDGLEVNSQD